MIVTRHIKQFVHCWLFYLCAKRDHVLQKISERRTPIGTKKEKKKKQDNRSRFMQVKFLTDAALKKKWTTEKNK